MCKSLIDQKTQIPLSLILYCSKLIYVDIPKLEGAFILDVHVPRQCMQILL